MFSSVSKTVLVTLALLVLAGAANAGEIRTPKDVREQLTLSAADYFANPEAWKPVAGEALKQFLSHRWLGGLYFEEDPLILGQVSGQALLLGVKGKQFTSQGEKERRADKGEIVIKHDEYCVYWSRYGQLCYKVLAQEFSGMPIYLIRRASGKPWAGIEILEK
ncbi:MAG: hypothetical protein OEN55_14490 [Alphaproteobacteria bacterium]|nr:hypothetical protein [Alphaproteobacteria bacterium]